MGERCLDSAATSSGSTSAPKGSPDPAATPIDVHVPEGDSGARVATVDGAPVVAAPGEEIQNAVLNRLHRLALAAGRPVLATIHDRRVGYSVPLRVDPDGSSHLAAEPVPTAPEQTPAAPAEATVEVVEASAEAPVRQDRHTRVLRSVAPVRDSVPTFTLRALPEPAGTPPGTVAPPTGEFGPPPSMDAAATTRASQDAGTWSVPGPFATAPEPTPAPEPIPASIPEPAPATTPAPEPAGAPKRGPPPTSAPAPTPYSDPDPKPTPARGFDAVAEAVLGDAPLTAPGDATAPALLAEPTVRISEAVKEGRTRTRHGWRRRR
ncbi:hypothetical protein SVIOM342S_02876 [Streptomyces violaceorubidus]